MIESILSLLLAVVGVIVTISVIVFAATVGLLILAFLWVVLWPLIGAMTNN